MKHKKSDCGAMALGFWLGFAGGIIILKSVGLI